MPKQSGLNARLFVAGYDVSGDIGAVDTISSSVELLPATGIDKSAVERMKGLADGHIDFTSYFNPDPGQAHAAFSTLPSADVGTMFLLGTTVGNPGAVMVAKQLDYAPSRGDDGSLTCKIGADANAFGLEWGDQLTTGKQTLGGSGAGTVLDYGAAVGTTNFGLQAYLQVFSAVGTSGTVAIQGSSDNAVGDPYADIAGAVFSAVTPAAAPTSQRVQTSRTQAVERYLRVNVTGTFTSFVFAVVVVRNLIAWNP